MDTIGSVDSRHSQAVDTARDLDGHVLELDHIAIAVADLPEAITWYTQKLGFRVVERRTTEGERTAMTSAVLAAGSVAVVLVQGMQPESQVAKFVTAFGAGVQHIAFSVRDLDAAIGQVTARGGYVDTPIIQDEGIRQVFLQRDPGSGVRVELIERRGGTFSDDTVRQLFLTFESRDLY